MLITRPALVAALLVVLVPVALVPRQASAQVDCDTPDDLCTGDPCMIGTAIVGTTCELDFGSRTVIVAGRLRLPSDGALTLTAGAFRIDGAIENLRPVGAPTGGPQITLSASGDVELGGRIRLQGGKASEALPGSIQVTAGGSLLFDGAVSGTTSPTILALQADGGDLIHTGRINLSRPQSSVSLGAAGAAILRGSLRKLDHIAVGAGGAVELRGSIVPRAALTVDAAGAVTLAAPLRAQGADVALRGGAGVSVEKPIYLMPLFVLAGSLELASSAGPVRIAKPVRSLDVSITAAGDVTVDAVVSASPPARSGDTIRVTSGGDVFVNDRLRAQSGDGIQPGDGAGGQIDVAAAGLVQIGADVLVNGFPGTAGSPGGTLTIEAGRIVVAGARFDADGDAPGPHFPDSPPAGFHLLSTSGEIALDGIFEARGGPSVIEAVAATDLTATGKFSAAPSGCIALAAAGAVETSGATFDTPVVADCP